MKIMLVVFSIAMFIALPVKEAFTEELYLQRGVGIKDFLEIGKKAEISGQEELYGRYLEEYGLTFEQHKVSDIILVLRCNKVGCKTDKNIGIGSQETDVVERFGSPREKKNFNKDKKLFISYDGVAFFIIEGRVDTIFILPVMKK